ncbi:type-4 ice-structuring protein LS-12 [Austrofundulus limnaeus]|uniref:Type-4 ice-structuring protein LS-12 n=1 Tax=Austrofundulus limnaeus TaxID=52670 RepID=A0A2I4CG12_AUSLI|nr:PREDICTED: type-4 ice-structuring protein LS-12-like [Austrofundulus limnaeus]
MKFSLVAALLMLLAFAYSSEARTLVRRDVQSDVDKISQLFRDMSTSLSSATQDMVDRMKTIEMTNNAQIQPLMESVQAEATKLQEQVKPYFSNIEEQMKPLRDSLQTQVKPLADLMEKFLQDMVDQSKALLPPQ